MVNTQSADMTVFLFGGIDWHRVEHFFRIINKLKALEVTESLLGFT